MTARAESASDVLARYYRLHAPLYDATRWAFLFGRQRAIQAAAQACPVGGSVLDIGCGTGGNLQQLAARRPDIKLAGCDLSPAMLSRAQRRVPQAQLRAGPFQPADWSAPDVILFSYMLSMTGDHAAALLAQAMRLLAPGGKLVVVDFHDTPNPWFARWMGVNHVRMQGELPGYARRLGGVAHIRRFCAYGGWWRYVLMTVAKPQT